jgi:Fic-DOC domain mobile mystery protein B
VWSWAGTYRRRELNLGIDSWRVPAAVRDLNADAAYWFADEAAMPVDEAAARFHHRLVEIHPFPNGNGRHARALTDLILVAAGTDPFAWGGRDLGPISSVRRTYVDALRAADGGDYDALLRFLRS